MRKLPKILDGVKQSEKEIDALEANNTWSVEVLPDGKRPIDGKWVFKVKHEAEGSIERYKACLVAKGFA